MTSELAESVVPLSDAMEQLIATQREIDRIINDALIGYGHIFHPTIPPRFQLVAYVPRHGDKEPPQVRAVSPNDVASEEDRKAAVWDAIYDGNLDPQKPIIFIDNSWLSEWPDADEWPDNAGGPQ